MTPRPLVITIDGPAGSGKSSTAREVARRLGLRHLDSGSLYRAVAWGLLDAGVDPGAWHALTEDRLRALDLRVVPQDEGFAVSVGGRRPGAELRTPEVSALASRLAPLPVVRRCLLDLQRAAAAAGVVADGRDMGTVVFPDADLKVYMDADLPERARRRLSERGRARPTPAELEAEAEALRERDRRDSERTESPLRIPDDAWVLDTSRLTFEEQVDAIVRRARRLTLS